MHGEGFEQGTVITATFTFRQSGVLVAADSVTAEVYLGPNLVTSLVTSAYSTGYYLADWQIERSATLSENYSVRWEAFKGSSRATEAELAIVKRTGMW